ncbi:Hypothetical predicted protein [Paramuricea clavata]|uniref:Uncharacterized protein n=1 Tax=Paramuricea clavata TaxID=317549 RepID=A0A6S7FRG7_PARCT|nr:Hypothetical predicted protein [Paramuricea clavata]
MASNVKKAVVKDLLEANKLIRKVKSESVSLKFQNLGFKDLHLLVYSDASHGNAEEDHSQGGQIVFLVEGEGKCIPICWTSKRIRRRSTLAAETLSMVDGIDLGIFLATLFCDLYYGVADSTLLPIKCITDCKSFCDAIKSNKLVTEKRLRLELSAIKENIHSN